jgi:hypothetical protein
MTIPAPKHTPIHAPAATAVATATATELPAGATVMGYPVLKHPPRYCVCAVCSRPWDVFYVRPVADPRSGKVVFTGFTSFHECDPCRLDRVLGLLNLHEPWSPPQTQAQAEAARLRALGLTSTAAALAGGAPWKPPAGVLDLGVVYIQPWVMSRVGQTAFLELLDRQAAGDLGDVGTLSAAVPDRKYLDVPVCSPDILTRCNVSLTLGAGPVLGRFDLGLDPDPLRRGGRIVLELLTVLSPARGPRTVAVLAGGGLADFVGPILPA